MDTLSPFVLDGKVADLNDYLNNKEIGIDAVTKNRISGLLQFIPRYNTIIKVGSY